jgi:hypothetical protein
MQLQCYPCRRLPRAVKRPPHCGTVVDADISRYVNPINQWFRIQNTPSGSRLEDLVCPVDPIYREYTTMDHNGLDNDGEIREVCVDNIGRESSSPVTEDRGGSSVRSFCEAGIWCLRTPETRETGKATRSVHETGSFRELLDLGGKYLAQGDAYS